MTQQLINENKKSLFLVSLENNDPFFASHDMLTGLPNKKGFIEKFNEELENPDHGGGVLLLIDIQQLKRTNLMYGRHTGDSALRLVADVLKTQKRGQDIVARLYKDKFVLALTNTTTATGLLITNRINEMLNSLKLKTAGDQTIQLNVDVAAVPYVKEDNSKTVLSMAGRLLEGRKSRQPIPAYSG